MHCACLALSGLLCTHLLSEPCYCYVHFANRETEAPRSSRLPRKGRSGTWNKITELEVMVLGCEPQHAHWERGSKGGDAVSECTLPSSGTVLSLSCPAPTHPGCSPPTPSLAPFHSRASPSTRPALASPHAPASPIGIVVHICFHLLLPPWLSFTHEPWTR